MGVFFGLLVGCIGVWWFWFGFLLAQFDCAVSPSSLFLRSFLSFSETRLPCRAVRGHLPVVSGVTV